MQFVVDEYHSVLLGPLKGGLNSFDPVYALCTYSYVDIEPSVEFEPRQKLVGC